MQLQDAAHEVPARDLTAADVELNAAETLSAGRPGAGCPYRRHERHLSGEEPVLMLDQNHHRQCRKHEMQHDEPEQQFGAKGHE